MYHVTSILHLKASSPWQWNVAANCNWTVFPCLHLVGENAHSCPNIISKSPERHLYRTVWGPVSASKSVTVDRGRDVLTGLSQSWPISGVISLVLEGAVVSLPRSMWATPGKGKFPREYQIREKQTNKYLPQLANMDYRQKSSRLWTIRGEIIKGSFGD